MRELTTVQLLTVGILLGNAVIVTESFAADVRIAHSTTGVVGDTCFVADPTSSQLNVRIVGQIPNSSEVVIKAIKKDRKGKAWAKIIQQGSQSITLRHSEISTVPLALFAGSVDSPAVLLR